MSQSPQAFDALFQAADKAAHLNTPPSGAELAIEDFNDFFEKLSGLDDLRWSDTAAAASRSKPAEAKVEPPARPKAAGAQPARGPVAAPQPAPKAAAPPTPQPAGKVASRLFRLGVVATVLFCIGMGAGWAALSLPKRGGVGAAAFAQPPATEESAPAQVAATAAPAEPIDAAAAPAAPAPKEAVTAAGTTGAPVKPNAAKAPAIKPAAMQPKAVQPRAAQSEAAGPEATVQAATAATPDPASPAVEAAAGNPEPSAPKAEQAAETTAAGAAPEAAAGSAAKSEARYAIQVGACRSPACADNYRRLLAAHVGTHDVQVQSQAGGGNPSVQRVRVAGLTKAEAQELKQALEQADARLKNAYIVKVF
jgi:hypothetical protein